MKILFGITSGIALYKTPNIVRMLTKSGHTVKVIMTANAAKLINPLIYQTLTHQPVYVEDFDRRQPLAHIELGDWADEFVIAPMTANTLSKIAHGIADNLITSTVLACDKKKILFPAMNVKMFENPIIQENLKKLCDLGMTIIHPDYGDLACGYSGRGRLPDESVIFGIITRDIDSPLSGKKFVVTAGGTVEKIDPVRYISNFSSGKMGIEIAKTLYRKGADVLLIYGNVSAEPVHGADLGDAGDMADPLPVGDGEGEDEGDGVAGHEPGGRGSLHPVVPETHEGPEHAEGKDGDGHPHDGQQRAQPVAEHVPVDEREHPHRRISRRDGSAARRLCVAAFR